MEGGPGEQLSGPTQYFGGGGGGGAIIRLNKLPLNTLRTLLLVVVAKFSHFSKLHKIL